MKFQKDPEKRSRKPKKKGFKEERRLKSLLTQRELDADFKMRFPFSS